MKNSKTIAIIIVIVVVVAGILFATSGKKDDTSKQSATTNKTVAESDAVSTSSVTISNFAFGPRAITVKAGTAVTWTNSDDVGHTVTADTATDTAPKSKTFSKGETFTFTFDKAGTYTYHCEPHPYMHGTVIVTQ